MAAGEDVTVADLTRQLKQAFEEISLEANYPMPTFNGKKGENPEDHCMKAEDYFKVYVMHQQDCLLLSQLRLTFPSSMDGARSQNRSKLPRPLKLDNQTPPTMSNRAQFGM